MNTYDENSQYAVMIGSLIEIVNRIEELIKDGWLYCFIIEHS